MKNVIAVIRPFKLEAVQKALEDLGCTGFTSREIKMYNDRRKTRSEPHRGQQFAVDYLPKVEVVATVDDDESGRAVAAILKAAKTGRDGDGSITVVPVESLWDIRDGKLLATSK